MKYLLIVILLFCGACFAEEDYTDLFASAAKRYVKEHIGSDQKEQAWNKCIANKVKQKVEDNSVLNENSALNVIILDFLSGLHGAKITPKLKLEIALFFTYYKNNNFELPEIVKEHLTLNNYNEWVKSEVNE